MRSQISSVLAVVGSILWFGRVSQSQAVSLRGTRDIRDVGNLVELRDMLRLRAPADPGNKLDVREAASNADQDVDALVGAGVDHANLKLVDVVADLGHTACLGIEIRERAVDKEVGLELSVLLGIVVDGTRDRPDAIDASQELVLNGGRQAVAIDAGAIGSKGQLLRRMDNGNALEGAVRHARGELHRQGVVEDDVCGVEVADGLLKDAQENADALWRLASLLVVGILLLCARLASGVVRVAVMLGSSTNLEVDAVVLVELENRVRDVKGFPRYDNIVDAVGVVKRLDAHVVVEALAIGDGEGVVGNVRLDASGFGEHGKLLDLFLEAVADLGNLVTAGAQLTQQVDVGLVSTRGGAEALGRLDKENAELGHSVVEPRCGGKQNEERVGAERRYT